MKLFIGLGLAALLFAGDAASAATITRTVTYDLSTADVSGGQLIDVGGAGFSTLTPFALEAGDTLDLTIGFLSGQRLRVTGAQAFQVSAWTSDDPSTVFATGRLSLGTADPVGTLTSDEISDVEGLSSFGQYFGDGDFATLPGTVAITGLHYVGTLTAYDPGVASRTYDTPALLITGERLNVEQASAVPEPATWALMVLGFGAVGAATRRRLSRVAFA